MSYNLFDGPPADMYDDDEDYKLPPNVGPDGEILDESFVPTSASSAPAAASTSAPSSRGQMYPPDAKLTGPVDRTQKGRDGPLQASTVATHSIRPPTISAPAARTAPILRHPGAPTIVRGSPQTFSSPKVTPPVASPGSYANVSSSSSSSSSGSSSGYSSGWNADVWKQNQQAVAQYQNTGTRLQISIYTDKTFIVRGETEAHKSELKKLDGKFTTGKRQNAAPGWFWPNNHFEKVKEYVEGVNAGMIASPEPTAPMQTVHWEVFRPQKSMKVNIEVHNEGTGGRAGTVGHAVYVISDVEQTGWPVTKATMYATHDPTNIQDMEIISGEWQIRHFQQRHTISAVVEKPHVDSSMDKAMQHMKRLQT